MKRESRVAFSVRQRKWFLKRDKNTCQAPFPHICDTDHPLQVHHIKPHGYLKRVAPGVSADYPENAITLCRTAHEVIHPDVIWARNGYHYDNDIFSKLRKQRSFLMENHRIYWNDNYDRPMEVIALVNTSKYIKKHHFPVFNHHKKHENFEEDQD